MKTIFTALYIAIFALRPVLTGAEPVQGFGEKVPVEVLNKLYFIFSIACSPDGNFIAASFEYPWCPDAGVYLFPTSGKNPVKLLGGDEIKPMNFFFLSDGQHIITENIIYDEKFGAIIEEKDGKEDRSQGLPVIEKININTRETQILAHGYLILISPDDKYMIYKNFDYRVYFDDLQEEHHRAKTLMDITTGKKTYIIEISESDFRSIGFDDFSPDGKYMIFTKYYERGSQIWKTTFNDGIIDLDNAKQITFENENLWSMHQYRGHFLPNGEWIIHIVSHDIEEFCGVGYNFNGEKKMDWCTDIVYNFVAFNIHTGHEIVLLPEDGTKRIRSHCFTSNGDKMCYILEDENDQRNHGIYILDLPPELHMPTSVGERMPVDFRLTSNYPNPFNPMTTIEFALPEAGFANLVIYNIMGQKVRSLVSEYMTPGLHSVVWNGCDDRGLPVSSGVYVMKLRMNDAVATGRITLVK